MTRVEEIKKEAKNKYPYIKGLPQTTSHQEIFIQGAEWADKTMIDKACEMLYAMLTTQDINDYDYVTAPAYDNVEDFIEDFRKAMEK